jgi:hypothetical protein
MTGERDQQPDSIDPKLLVRAARQLAGLDAAGAAKETGNAGGSPA